MFITVAVIIIVLATFLLIMYNMYSDYQARRDADLRAMINRARNTVTETEDLLANQTNLPYSKTLILLLRHRMLSALKRIKQDPHAKSIDIKIEEQLAQIQQINTVFTEDLSFRPPESDTAAVAQLRAIRKLRTIIRHELHAGTPVDRADCLREDKRLSLLIIKINIANLVERVVELKRLRQVGTCRQLIEKGLEVIKKSGYKDEWLMNKADVLKQLQFDIDHEIKDEGQKEIEKANETDEQQDEINQLFAEKKKW